MIICSGAGGGGVGYTLCTCVESKHICNTNRFKFRTHCDANRIIRYSISPNFPMKFIGQKRSSIPKNRKKHTQFVWRWVCDCVCEGDIVCVLYKYIFGWCSVVRVKNGPNAQHTNENSVAMHTNRSLWPDVSFCHRVTLLFCTSQPHTSPLLHSRPSHSYTYFIYSIFSRTCTECRVIGISVLVCLSLCYIYMCFNTVCVCVTF